MDSIIFKKFGTCKELSEGCFPLFGFAVADYLAEQNLTTEDLEDLASDYIFGAVMEHGDLNEDFHAFMEKLLSDEDGVLVSMCVFDFGTFTDQDIEDLKFWFENAAGWRELKDVYEDRIVFVR